MANQFTTGQGQGYDPNDDPMKRTLASGVNAGQAQPNMDPGKVGNPYAGGGAQPAAAPPAGNPYAGPPPGAQAPRSAPGNPYSSAPTPSPAPARTAQASPAAAPAPAPPPARSSQAVPAPPPAGMSVSSTGTLQPAQNMNTAGQPVIGMPSTPGGQIMQYPTGTDPAGAIPQAPGGGGVQPSQDFIDYGAALKQAASGQQTADQQQAERDAAWNTYYTGANKAAESSASRGLGASSGLSQRDQLAVQGAAEQARVGTRAAETEQARTAYSNWQQQAIQQQQAEAERQLKAYEDQIQNTQFSQAQKAKLIEAERQRQANLLSQAIGLAGGAIGSVGGPIGTAIGTSIGNVAANALKGNG